MEITHLYYLSLSATYFLGDSNLEVKSAKNWKAKMHKAAYFELDQLSKTKISPISEPSKGSDGLAIIEIEEMVRK